MATFNRLLRKAGIDPREVSLLRHQTERGGRTPNWLWENDREGFLRYQSTQQDRPVFRNSRYWASFVSPAKHETKFVGLFEARFRPDVKIDWKDPLAGGPVGDGKAVPYYYFQCEPVAALQEHADSLRIEWGDAQRQWTQYAAANDKQVVGGLRAARSQPSAISAADPAIGRIFELIGFETRHRTQKLTMLENASGIVIYLKNETRRCPVVIHPYYDGVADRLHALPGIARDPARVFYVNSNLSAFPVYLDPSRATSSRYGIALDVDDAASAARLARMLADFRTIQTPLGEVVIGDPDDAAGSTDRQVSRLARIGQGGFRLALNQAWDWRCAVSGIGLQELLRASHIKPWSEASDAERLDPYNGLLLAAHIDALFDKHLISFDDDGAMIVSARIDNALLSRLGIDRARARITGLDDRHRRYLAHHRTRLQLQETVARY